MAKKKTTSKTSKAKQSKVSKPLKASKILQVAAGTPIELTDAKLYVDEYIKLKKKLKSKVLTKVTQSERDGDNDLKKADKHFNSTTNAFIFSKETIMRFFDGTLNNGQTADYLVVFFAAKFKDDKDKSNPTVVVAGVNEKDAGEYVSLNIDKPATEQPPSKVEYQFPDPKRKDTSERLIVKLK